MFLYEVICTVLMDLFDRYNNYIAQHITIIVTVESCLATGTSSEE